MNLQAIQLYSSTLTERGGLTERGLSKRGLISKYIIIVPLAIQSDDADVCGRHTHFGALTTSRIEGSHAGIKDWIGSTRHDLLGVFEKFNCYLRGQFTGLQHSIQKRTPYDLSGEFWQSCLHVIHEYGIRQAMEQHKMAVQSLRDFREKNKPFKSCTHAFTTTMGKQMMHSFID